MQKSPSPQLKKSTKNHLHPYYQHLKVPMNLYALQLPLMSQLQYDLVHRNVKKSTVKQIGANNQSNRGGSYLPKTITQVEHDTSKIAYYKFPSNGQSLEKHAQNHSYTSSLENIITDLKAQQEDKDNLIRHYEFKINRLSQELQHARSQYTKLYNKVFESELKHTYLPQTKLVRSTMNFQQLDSRNSLQKRSSVHDNGQLRNVQVQLQLLKSNQKQLLQSTQTNNMMFQQMFEEFSKQLVENVHDYYSQTISALEELLRETNKQHQKTTSMFVYKYEIINREVQAIEIQKEMYYDKVILQLQS